MPSAPSWRSPSGTTPRTRSGEKDEPVNPATDRPTSPTRPTGDDNSLKNKDKNSSENMGCKGAVGRPGSPTTSSHEKRGPARNPITGKLRPGVGHPGRPTNTSSPTNGASADYEKPTDKSTTYDEKKPGVGDVGDVGPSAEGFCDDGLPPEWDDLTIPGFLRRTPPLAIDLTLLPPGRPDHRRAPLPRLSGRAAARLRDPLSRELDPPRRRRRDPERRSPRSPGGTVKPPGSATWPGATAATPMAKRPSPSAIAIQGTAWQTFLTSQAVKIRMVNDAAMLAELAQELAAVARAGEPVALDFETIRRSAAGAIRPRLIQLFAGADEAAVADLDLTGFAPIACLADVGCIAYGAGFEARVFLAHGLEPQLNDAELRPVCGSIGTTSSATWRRPGDGSSNDRRRPTRRPCRPRTSRASSPPSRSRTPPATP